MVNEYIVVPDNDTWAKVKQFLTEQDAPFDEETEAEFVNRGILGYLHGKTIVLADVYPVLNADAFITTLPQWIKSGIDPDDEAINFEDGDEFEDGVPI